MRLINGARSRLYRSQTSPRGATEARSSDPGSDPVHASAPEREPGGARADPCTLRVFHGQDGRRPKGVTAIKLGIHRNHDALLVMPMSPAPALAPSRIRKLMIFSAPARADTRCAVTAMVPDAGPHMLSGPSEGSRVTLLQMNTAS